jgi:hypothetical protein
VQVLFNEQSDRDCAVCTERCHRKTISTGGWLREAVGREAFSACSSEECLPSDETVMAYSIHEAALFPLTKLIDTQGSFRDHSFLTWPGYV